MDVKAANLVESVEADALPAVIARSAATKKSRDNRFNTQYLSLDCFASLAMTVL
jgi:hypothetical protein